MIIKIVLEVEITKQDVSRLIGKTHIIKRVLAVGHGEETTEWDRRRGT